MAPRCTAPDESCGGVENENELGGADGVADPSRGSNFSPAANSLRFGERIFSLTAPGATMKSVVDGSCGASCRRRRPRDDGSWCDSVSLVTVERVDPVDADSGLLSLDEDRCWWCGSREAGVGSLNFISSLRLKLYLSFLYFVVSSAHARRAEHLSFLSRGRVCCLLFFPVMLSRLCIPQKGLHCRVMHIHAAEVVPVYPLPPRRPLGRVDDSPFQS